MIYCVSGIWYNKNYEVADSLDFGEYNEPTDAFNEFIYLSSQPSSNFFKEKDKEDYYIVKIQIEKCEETEDGIECVDVLNEVDMYNPKFDNDIDNTDKIQDIV